MSVRLIQALQAKERRGSGVPGDPWRVVTVYYTVEGDFLAENDPCFEFIWARRDEEKETGKAAMDELTAESQRLGLYDELERQIAEEFEPESQRNGEET